MSPQINLTFAAPTVADFIQALEALRSAPIASAVVSAVVTPPAAPKPASASPGPVKALSPGIEAEALDRINAARVQAGMAECNFIRFSAGMADLYGTREAYVEGVAQGTIEPYLWTAPKTEGGSAPALATPPAPVPEHETANVF